MNGNEEKIVLSREDEEKIDQAAAEILNRYIAAFRELAR